MSTIRTPEPFWKTTGPRTPWGEFDPNAVLDFSFDLGPWVDSAGTDLTVINCDVTADSALQTNDQLAAKVVTVRVRAAAENTLSPGTYLWFRLRATLSDGQRDDRTFWLIVRER